MLPVLSRSFAADFILRLPLLLFEFASNSLLVIEVKEVNALGTPASAIACFSFLLLKLVIIDDDGRRLMLPIDSLRCNDKYDGKSVCLSFLADTSEVSEELNSRKLR